MLGKKNQTGVSFDEPKAKKKKKKLKIGWIILIIVVILIACGVNYAKKAVKELTDMSFSSVSVETIERGNIEEFASASGTVVPESKEIVLSPVSAVVKEVNVSYGDYVKKGDVLVTFELESLEQQLYQSKLQLERNTLSFESTIADNNDAGAKLVEANTNLKVLNQQIADSEAYLKELKKQYSGTQRADSTGLATRSYQLQQQLQSLVPGSDEYNSVSAQISAVSFQQSILSSSDYYVQMEQKISEEQERLSGYQEYKAKMESQKASAEAVALDSSAKRQLNIDLELAELSYKQVEEAYEKAAKGVVAEADGVIDQVMVMKGSTAGEGMQLMNLNSTEGFIVDLSASKTMANKLSLGQEAELTINNRKYHGVVSKMDHMAIQDAKGGVLLGVEIQVTDPDESIILGWDAKAKISVGKAENVLIAPLQTVYSDNDGDFVFLYKNGKAVKTYVETGLSMNGRIEIKEGLKEGDEILNDQSGILEDGMDVSALIGM